MEHLGMELYAPDTALGRGRIGGEVNVFGRSDGPIAFGDGGDGVTMTHPHLRRGCKAFEEGVGGIELLQVSPSVLSRIGLFDLASTLMSHKLSAVTDAQDGQATHKST